jgi:hypothetical protein
LYSDISKLGNKCPEDKEIHFLNYNKIKTWQLCFPELFHRIEKKGRVWGQVDLKAIVIPGRIRFMQRITETLPIFKS